MAQNRSSAVMQQRREPHDSLDYFPTPPWATRALCEYLGQGETLAGQTVWEPACGEGHMARPLAEYFGSVSASDVHDYSEAYDGQARVCDFLIEWSLPPRFEKRPPEWIITNPPFRLAEAFVYRALQVASVGCAMLVRTSFLEGQERFRSLYQPWPPALILQFTERCSMVKGRLDPTVASATSYCWVVWLQEPVEHTRFDWIAPCRGRLERPGDYPVAEVVDADTPLLDRMRP